MTISFGGLATGLDTTSIINGLMQLERAPLTRLETDKVWMNSRLTAFTEFDGKLNAFLQSAETLADRDQYNAMTSTLSSNDFLTASVSDNASAGTSYEIEVQSIALVQKSHSDNGYSSETAEIFAAGDLTVTVDGTDHIISIGAGQNTLQGVMQAINDADIGVSAAIINDGSDTDPYRLTLTGQDVATGFSINGTGIDGSESLGTFTVYQAASQATIVIDGITITSDSNTISDAITGVTLNLLKEEVGTTTTLDIEKDNSVIEKNLAAFVEGYNQVISFITKQSTMGDTSGGVLGGDSGLNSIKRHLQDMLTTYTDNTGTYKAFAELGLETQKDGTLVLNNETLSNAIDTDLDSVVSLLAGDEDGNEEGLASQFASYLEGLTSSTIGVLAGRKKSINNNIARIDKSIEQMEMRLAKREETLKTQFNALEQLVSVMNAQSDYLGSQLKSLESLWNYKK